MRLLVIVTLVAVRTPPVPGLALAVAAPAPGLALEVAEPVPEVWTMTADPVVTSPLVADVSP